MPRDPAKKRAYHKAWRDRHPERVNEWARKNYLRRMLAGFGLSPADYEHMLAGQGGGCAICRGPSGTHRFHVDHDHMTGKVRGLLCGSCNRGVGYLRDDPARLLSALLYLKRSLK